MMVANKPKHPWHFSFGVWSAFIVATILYVVFNYDLYFMLGLLTAAIISNDRKHCLYWLHKTKSKGKIRLTTCLKTIFTYRF